MVDKIGFSTSTVGYLTLWDLGTERGRDDVGSCEISNGDEVLEASLDLNFRLRSRTLLVKA